MRSVKIQALQILRARAADRFRKPDRITDRLDVTRVIRRRRRFLQPRQIPILRMVQIRESTIDQCTYEIHRHRRPRMPHDHPHRIRLTRRRIKFRLVNQVTAIRWQRHTITRFEIRRPRLCILPCKSPNANHRLPHAMRKHDAHLQQNFQPIRNDIRLALIEALRTVATLQEKPLPFLRIRNLTAQRLDFPRGH